eukprot:TRINITY_DN6595_c0_g1_i1.p1 TRINITY_DN6595_c0_g1~~TRINITY_DN6595_c0_g1_i1.p1  ORF type:complete len:266 (-),score=6.53 TRINITY_DN6595_c0_g1_i1:1-798(-)
MLDNFWNYELLTLQSICFFFILFGLVLFLLSYFSVVKYSFYGRANDFFPNLPHLSANVSWFCMEIPSLIVSVFSFCVLGDRDHLSSVAHWILISLYWIHYIHRSILYPLKMKGKPLPFIIPLCAAIFCTINGYMQGRFLGHFSEVYPIEYLYSLRFIVGVSLFIYGMGINIYCDNILSNLRKPGEEHRYKIPYGGAFNFVTAGNYFGEVLEWSGYALACGTLASVSFFLFALLFLSAQGTGNHRWYHAKFENYPKNRKIIIPLIY